MSAVPEPAPDTSAPPAFGFRVLLAATLILGIVAAYAGSFTAPFRFDDRPSIVENASIRNPWSFDWLEPPATAGETVSGRPVLNLSFAFNYALDGLDVRGYHAVNLLIHAATALLLFGIIRRTWWRQLARVRGRAPVGAAPVWLGAFVLALVWALHPLHTAAVTYVVQRAESLAGFFYLLTLYCFIRSLDGSGGDGRNSPSAAAVHLAGAGSRWHRRPTPPDAVGAPWRALAVVACLLGMGTKETVATAPLLVLLYDRAFAAGSWREAWRERRRFYAALAATWLVLAALVAANPGRGGSAGLGGSIDPWTYLLTQCGAIVRYVGLALWPRGQVFDYGVQTVSGIGAVLPALLLLAAIIAAGAWMLIRNRPAGFLIASFFLLLAPSSSVIPVATQTIAEHRMYLPLATVIIVIGCGLWRALPWFSRQPGRERHGAPREPREQAAPQLSSLPPLTPRVKIVASVLAATAVLALGGATLARNRVYQSEISLWQDTVTKRPDNPRAQHNLGVALAAAGRIEEAMAAYRTAIALQPSHALARCELGIALLEQGRAAEAEPHLRAALAADPAYSAARVNLGRALTELGQTDEAIAHYQAVLAVEPGATDAGTNLAALWLGRGRAAEAATLLRQVLAAEPKLAEAHYHLGRALEKTDPDALAAEEAWREAVRLKPDLAPAQLALANALARRGDLGGAETAYRHALQSDTRSAEARFGLGNVLARRREFASAIEQYEEALRVDPGHFQARSNLGNCLLATGSLPEAIRIYEEVLARRPEDQTVKRNLELARQLIRQAPGSDQ